MYSSIHRQIWVHSTTICLGLLEVLIYSHNISDFRIFGPEHYWRDISNRMYIWCIKIGIVYEFYILRIMCWFELEWSALGCSLLREMNNKKWISEEESVKGEANGTSWVRLRLPPSVTSLDVISKRRLEPLKTGVKPSRFIWKGKSRGD